MFVVRVQSKTPETTHPGTPGLLINRAREVRSEMNTAQATKDLSAQIPLSMTTVYAISAAMLIGVLIITAVGFAGPEVMHNAAHDLRHSLAFPCH